MILILAHHLEAHHVAIALLLVATGSAVGWMGCGRWLASRMDNQRLS